MIGNLMKVAKTQKHIEELNVNENSAVSFGIRNTEIGFILEILRKGMYKDPIGSIVREIASNAIDAHIEAGIPERPIEIHLPDYWNPEFSIRDYGNGMSPTLVREVLVNYGASTKNEDNNTIGGFGLGSKIGWAYGDSFNIVTIYKGIKYSYTAVIDDTNTGKLYLLNESPTDEPSGTKYTVPVRDGDYSTFKQKTIYYGSFFHIKPKVHNVGPTPIVWNTMDENYKGEKWAISNSLSTTAMIGFIPYPIDVYSMGNLESSESQLLRSRLILYFNIGDLDLSANRENLRYTDTTINKIKESLDIVSKEIIKTMEDKLSSLDNLWDVTLEYKSSNNYLSRFYGRYSYNLNINWRSYVINDSYQIPDNYSVSYYNLRNQKIYNYSNSNSITPMPRCLLLFNDIGNRTFRNRLRTVFNTENDVNKIALIKVTDDSLLDKPLPKDISIFKPKLLSNYEPTSPPKTNLIVNTTTKGNLKADGKKPRGFIHGFTFNPAILSKQSGNKGLYKYLEPAHIDPSIGGVYILVNQGNMVPVEHKLSTYSGYLKHMGFYNNNMCESFLSACKKLLNLDNLYAFKQKDAPNDDNWINLWDALQNFVKPMVDNKDDLVMALAFEPYNMELKTGIKPEFILNLKLNPNTNIVQWAKLSISIKERIDNADDNLLDLINHYLSIYPMEELDTITKIVDKFYQTYPLVSRLTSDISRWFRFLGSNNYDDLLNALGRHIEYLSMVEESNS